MSDETPAIAILNGTPFHDVPQDLYIPPDALEILLDTFEGPLDLLLYLIRKQNVDILNIPIAQISRQYVEYIRLMEALNIELAADYLVMAALLAEIKSRLLLPRPSEIEAEDDDPRATLIRRLQAYEIIKTLAQEIDLLPRLEREIFLPDVEVANLTLPENLPDVTLNELLRALQQVLKRTEQTAHHHIIKEPLSVRERMSAILLRLSEVKEMLFTHLFTVKEGKHGVVVTFLAILELSKEGLIEILQDEPLAQLSVRGQHHHCG
ncbi:MAG: ScpA family protein [Methylococcales bacterium]|nr:ScpA family protein [Methylococcales bacterium]